MPKLIDLDQYSEDKDCCGEYTGYYTIDVDDIEEVNAIVIPEGATNGDMIKAIFPNAEFDNAMPFTDGRWEIMNLDTENEIRATYKPTQLRTYEDWWNAPYKKDE